jgi:hypothetical protein
MDLMNGSVIELDRSDLEAHVEAPGVAVVCWREHGNIESHRLDRAMEQAVRKFPDVRFATVDIGQDEGLAEEWGVQEVASRGCGGERESGSGGRSGGRFFPGSRCPRPRSRRS